MELYLSDHPSDCAGCERGSCEMQRLAHDVGLAEVRYGLGGASHLAETAGRVEPLLRLRPGRLHRLLAVRAGLLRDPGHLRAHRVGARLRLADHPRRHRLPVARSASRAAPACRPARPTPSPRSRSSRSGCRPARWSRRAPTAGSAARSRPRCRARATRPGSCGWCRGRTAAPTRGTRASRAASPTATPRTATGRWRRWCATRSTTSGRSSRGRRRSSGSPPGSSGCARSTASVRSAASRRRGAPTRRSTSSRRWCGRRSATTTSTPARGSATPPPATG